MTTTLRNRCAAACTVASCVYDLTYHLASESNRVLQKIGGIPDTTAERLKHVLFLVITSELT
jgi:hypothetical protein